jgi:thiamine pyrophosphate-dependent acetolactate synthase large subunit-like protein
VIDPEELAPAIQEAFARQGPALLDVPIESDCGVLADEE